MKSGALVVLGFPQTTAEKTVHKVYVKEPDLSVEDLIRKALSEI